MDRYLVVVTGVCASVVAYRAGKARRAWGVVTYEEPPCSPAGAYASPSLLALYAALVAFSLVCAPGAAGAAAAAAAGRRAAPAGAGGTGDRARGATVSRLYASTGFRQQRSGSGSSGSAEAAWSSTARKQAGRVVSVAEQSGPRIKFASPGASFADSALCGGGGGGSDGPATPGDVEGYLAEEEAGGGGTASVAQPSVFASLTGSFKSMGRMVGSGARGSGSGLGGSGSHGDGGLPLLRESSWKEWDESAPTLFEELLEEAKHTTNGMYEAPVVFR